MHALYAETSPPTAVHGSLACRLLDASAPQLVTHSSTRLRVYRTNPYVLERQADNEWVQTTKLECMLSMQLLAPIRSFCSTSIPNSQLDMLWLAFDDAKLSALVYDRQKHELVTVSMHAFEEPLLRGGYVGRLQEPLVVADPESRCVAMLVYGRHLAIVPLSSAQYDDALGDAGAIVPSERRPTAEGPSALLGGVRLHSYVTSLADIDERLCNVASMCFLHAYYEPTLLLLYEPVQTTVGRLAIRQDTYCLLAVSLSLREQQHAVVWSVSNLPYDALRVQAVPRPVGGAILTCQNSIIYLNQAVPSFGVSVNGGYRGYTSFPMHEQNEMLLELTNSASDFLLPTSMLFALHDRKMITLSLLIDDVSTVRGVRVELCDTRAAPATTLTVLPSLVFVGSHLHDSQLFAYAERHVQPVQVTSDEQRAQEGREEDVDIYGEVITTAHVHTLALVHFHFELVDRIAHTGPLKEVCLASPAALSEPLQQNKLDPAFDLIFAASDGLSSTLVTMQRSLRPNIVTSSTLGGARSIHACGRRVDYMMQSFEGRSAKQVGKEQHRYVLVSRDASTMVLEAAEEIVELENGGPFITDEPTLLCADMHDNRVIVQVCSMSVCIVHNGSTRRERLSLDVTFPIRHASASQPYVVLVTENNQLLLLTVPEPGSEEFAQLKKLDELTAGIRATSACVYRDTSGLFALCTEVDVTEVCNEIEVQREPEAEESSTVEQPMEAINGEDSRHEASIDADFDDEDALLYGTTATVPQPTPVHMQAAESDMKKPQVMITFDRLTDTSAPTEMKVDRDRMQADTRADVMFTGGRFASCQLLDPNTVEPSYWLFVAREHSGTMDVYSLPELRHVFSAPHAAHVPVLLKDVETVGVDGAREEAALPLSMSDSLPRISELTVVSLGANGCRPHLFMIVEQQLYTYEIFALKSKLLGRLCVRFHKVRDACPSLYNRRQQVPNQSTIDLNADFQQQARQIYVIDAIGKYENPSVFVSGAYPYWLFLETAELRIHPVNIEVPNAIISLTPFSNEACARGCMYLNEAHVMRVVHLDQRFDYVHSPVPVWRQQIRPHEKDAPPSTVHHVAYLLNEHVMAITTSVPMPHYKLFEMVGDDRSDTKVELDPVENLPQPMVEKYTLSLHSMETMEPLPGTHVEFDEYEVVTCMKEVQLRSEASASGTANYIAAGTVGNYGEEVLIRGRLCLWEVIEVVPEPGQPDTRHKLKTLVMRDEKAPVTALTSANGHLLVATGQKVYIWGWRDNELIGISFIDLSFYIHHMIGLHGLCLAADIQRSIALLRYQENFKALSIVARDTRPNHVHDMPLTCDFVVDNRQLSFLMTDDDANMTLLVYAPEQRESLGGQRLLVRGELNIGTRVASIVRVQSRVSDPVSAADHEQRQAQMGCHVNLFGTLDGGSGAVTPIGERLARKLVMLQSLLTSAEAPSAGLNPREARHVRGFRNQKVGMPLGPVGARHLIDGDLVLSYMHLSLTQQHEIAKRLGTTRRQLHDDLLAIHRSMTHV